MRQRMGCASVALWLAATGFGCSAVRSTVRASSDGANFSQEPVTLAAAYHAFCMIPASDPSQLNAVNPATQQLASEPDPEIGQELNGAVQDRLLYKGFVQDCKTPSFVGTVTYTGVDQAAVGKEKALVTIQSTLTLRDAKTKQILFVGDSAQDMKEINDDTLGQVAANLTAYLKKATYP